jgi:uncharacterized membrane protein
MKPQFSRALLGAFFILAGINHFRAPGAYLQIMPPGLPYPEHLVALSGALEMAGGVGVLFSRTRRVAGWGLIALLIAVFPANIYAAQNGMELFGSEVPRPILWARLPLQLVFIWWVRKATLVSGER